MSSTVFNYHVTMEDGKEWDVTADQRDIAYFEVQPFGVPFYEAQNRPFTFARYLAFQAGKRNGHHKLTWDEFADQAVSVESTDEEDAEEPDPGQPAVSAESSSN